MYLLFKEYNIHVEYNIFKKYSSSAAKWYKAKHLAVLDGVVYTKSKPAKDFKESYERTIESILNKSMRS